MNSVLRLEIYKDLDEERSKTKKKQKNSKLYL